MRLKENQQPIELAAARRFQRGADFHRVVAVVIDDGDVVHDALDVKPAAHPGKFGETFADQIRGNIQIERHRRCSSSVAHVVHSRRMSQLEDAEIVAFVREPKFALETL